MTPCSFEHYIVNDIFKHRRVRHPAAVRYFDIDSNRNEKYYPAERPSTGCDPAADRRPLYRPTDRGVDLQQR